MPSIAVTTITGLPSGARAWTNPAKRDSTWGAGPWDDEPDKVSWTDTATGRPCLIVRGPLGALCGYVAVDPDHPWHGISYGGCPVEDCDESWCEHAPDQHVDVHGGLTYAAECAETDDEGTGICHVPEPGAPEQVWWFGFDCSHGGDLAPSIAAHARDNGLGYPLGRGDVYRTVGYVAGQCRQLAEQLAAVPA